MTRRSSRFALDWLAKGATHQGNKPPGQTQGALVLTRVSACYSCSTLNTNFELAWSPLGTRRRSPTTLSLLSSNLRSTTATCSASPPDTETGPLSSRFAHCHLRSVHVTILIPLHCIDSLTGILGFDRQTLGLWSPRRQIRRNVRFHSWLGRRPGERVH